MKKLLVAIVLFAFLLPSCAPRSQFQTREGKIKNKHYNSIQYEKNSWGK